MNHVVRPWYRHRWPWILMAGPALVVVAGVYTTYLAITSSDGLVVDDYYKQGKAINLELARDQRASELTARTTLHRSEQGDITLELKLSAESRVPQSLRLSLLHPTRAGEDQVVLLTPVPDRTGFYQGKISPFVGHRAVQVEDDLQSWRLKGDWQAKDETLVLQARPVTAQ